MLPTMPSMLRTMSALSSGLNSDLSCGLASIGLVRSDSLTSTLRPALRPEPYFTLPPGALAGGGSSFLGWAHALVAAHRTATIAILTVDMAIPLFPGGTTTHWRSEGERGRDAKTPILLTGGRGSSCLS